MQAAAQAPTPRRVRKSRRSGRSGPGARGSCGWSITHTLQGAEALHGDRPDGAAGGAEAAADADLLVLDHDGAGAGSLDQDRGQLPRRLRQVPDGRGGDDLDAVLGADVLAAAAEDAFAPLGRILLED